MNTKKFRTIEVDKALHFSKSTQMLFDGMSNDELMDLTRLWILNLLESMAENKGIEDVREYSGIAVEISHAVEAEMRDYIEFNLNNEYGPDEEEKNVSAE